MNHLELFEKYDEKDTGKKVNDILKNMNKQNQELINIVKPVIINFLEQFDIKHLDLFLPDDNVYDGNCEIKSIMCDEWGDIKIHSIFNTNYGVEEYVYPMSIDYLSYSAIVELYEYVTSLELEDMIVYLSNQKFNEDIFIKFIDKIDFNKTVFSKTTNVGDFLDELNPKVFKSKKVQEYLINNEPDIIVNLIREDNIKIDKDLAIKYKDILGALLDSKELGLL